MKNKFLKTMMFVTLLFVGGVMTDMNAQAHLEKWVEKCETAEDVDYSIISRRDKVTKKPLSTMISITFKKSNTVLMTALSDALSKDKKDAIQVIESKKGGVLKPEIYKFYDSATKQDISYIFSESKSGSISVVINTKSASDN